MPSNPQVPREVAEARGKGAGTVAVLGISLAAIGVIALIVVMSIASSTSGSVERAQAAKQAEAIRPGSTLCPGADTVEVPESGMTVIPLDTCQSGFVKLPESWKGVRLKTVDPSQGLGITWSTGETAWIGGDQALPLDPQGRKFRVWSDKKGQLQITPKETSSTAQTASTEKVGAAKTGEYLICSNTKDIAVTEDRPTAVVQLREDCWSGGISGFAESRISRRDDKDIEFLLASGERKLYRGPEKIPADKQFEWARVRGSGELKLWIPGFATLLPSGSVEPVPTEGVVTRVAEKELQPGSLTLQIKDGERTYVVGVFTFAYRPGGERGYLNYVRVGDRVRLELARDRMGGGMFVTRIDVMDDEGERREKASDGSPSAGIGEQANNGQAIPLILLGTVREKSNDTLRLRVNDTGVEVEVRNVRDLPVNYRGDTYRIRNLEVGDEVRLSYFPTTQVVGVASNITRPVKIEVLRSANR